MTAARTINRPDLAGGRAPTAAAAAPAPRRSTPNARTHAINVMMLLSVTAPVLPSLAGYLHTPAAGRVTRAARLYGHAPA